MVRVPYFFRYIFPYFMMSFLLCTRPSALIVSNGDDIPGFLYTLENPDHFVFFPMAIV